MNSVIDVWSPLTQFCRVIFTASVLMRSIQFSPFGVHLVYNICQEYIILDNWYCCMSLVLTREDSCVFSLFGDSRSFGWTTVPWLFTPHFEEVFYVKIGGVYVCVYGAFGC
ncbi:hypothetical protein AMTRI_Chr01g132250 [Amborella trichopoda]